MYGTNSQVLCYLGQTVVHRRGSDLSFVRKCGSAWNFPSSPNYSNVFSILYLAINIPLLAWLGTTGPTEDGPFKLLSNVALPVNFVQNVLTTGLIIFRLVRHHQASRVAFTRAALTSAFSLFFELCWKVQ